MKKLVSLLENDVLLFLLSLIVLIGAICAVYIGIQIWKINKSGD